MSTLEREPMPVAICERDLPRGTWKDVLDRIAALRHPPLLIVSSRLADDRLWAEALNLGAYDVLAKPFRADEVTRIVRLAWLHWRERHDAGLRDAIGSPAAAIPLYATGS